MCWFLLCLYYHFFFMFFFFFQAEDGIRDRDVTGVQTCALPIWIAVDRVHLPADRHRLHLPGEPHRQDRRPEQREVALLQRRRKPPPHHATLAEIGRASCRKECRSRWAQNGEKKKRQKEKEEGGQ